MNPGSPAPQASVFIQTTREFPELAVFHSRLRARIHGRFAKEISLLPPKTEETIINTLIALKANGLSKAVLKTISEKLRQIARHADLTNPNAVKQYISNLTHLKNTTKNKFVYAYDKFCQANVIEWTKPRYQEKEHVPIIPTTDNVNAIINTARKDYALVFTLLKETGASGQELSNVTRTDIDSEQGIIRIIGCKRHASATYKLKRQTAEMLRAYLSKHSQEHPFPSPKNMGEAWRKARRNASKKLCKPELNTIILKSLRNYSGAQLYHRTLDPIAVMRHLRHKKLETTMHYIRAIATTPADEEEYTVKATNDLNEIKQLIEQGFTKADEIDGLHIYKKRK